MSRRSRVVTLIVTLAGTRGSAQNLPRLERMWKDAARASARADSLALVRTRVALDTIHAGNLVFLAPPRLSGLAQRVGTSAWGGLLGTYGNQILPARHKPLVAVLYQSDNGPLPYGFPRDAISIPVSTGETDERMLTQLLSIRLEDALRTDWDPAFERWLQGGVRTNPVEPASPELFEDLVTSPSPLARSCYVGNVTACGSALGLIPPHDAATEWYDAPGRRALVTHLASPRPSSTWEFQCVEHGVDAACLQVLRGPDSISLMPPLISASRELAVRMALQTGGPEALHRLLVSAGQPMGRRLEAAAGITLDSLLTRWQHAVVLGRPQPVDVTPGIGWASLVWAVVFGVLVLGSSRWRL